MNYIAIVKIGEKEANINTHDTLIKGLKLGDENSFAQIYHEFARPLFKFIHQNISNRDDCEEIIQDLFTSLWQRRESLEIKSLSQYLFGAARFQIIKYIRASKVRTRYEEHYRLFEAVYQEEQPDPERLVANLETCLTQLPDRCRTAVLLRLRENLSNAEIARRMNITRKTVEHYMHKALIHLRTQAPRILQLD